MNNLSRKALLFSVFALSGCATPLVKYGEVKGPDENGMAKFSFAESVIKFSFKKGPGPAYAIEGVDIISVPVPESSGKKYFIAGTSVMENWGVKTEVIPAYRADTPLLQSVSVKVTDERITYIEKAGGVLAKAVGFFVAGSDLATTKLPDGIYMQKEINSCEKKADGFCDVKFDESSDYTARIRIGEKPIDSFVRPLAMSSDIYKSGSFIYSACRSADVQLFFKGSKVAESTVMISDSGFVQTLAFPDKGKVTAGSSCGATSASESAGLPNALDYVDALIGQAQVVAKAASK